MASKVQICNAALRKIRAPTITSLSDGTDSANRCNELFDLIADEVMVAFPWTSTLVRAELAQLSDTPLYGYNYQYQLPVDPLCLRVVSINEYYKGEINWRVEGNKLLTNESTVYIKYISKIEDPENYDVMLTNAIIKKLASELAYQLTGNATLAELHEKMYLDYLNKASALNSSQGSGDDIASTSLHEVRY